MLEVRFMVFCENVVREPNSQPWIYNPLITITPPFVPSTYTFGLAIGLDEIDPDEAYSLTLKVRDVNGRNVGDQEISIEKQREKIEQSGSFTRPDGLVNALLSLELKNFPLSNTGYYTAELTANGRVIGSTKLYVMQPKGKIGDE